MGVPFLLDVLKLVQKSFFQGSRSWDNSANLDINKSFLSCLGLSLLACQVRRLAQIIWDVETKSIPELHVPEFNLGQFQYKIIFKWPK